jgi:threonine/homoserine/homoserine lactone efflux protein
VESEAEPSPEPRSSARVPPHVSPLRWAAWWITLFFALIVFYGFFSIFWFGLRGAAWLAEFRARRHRSRLAGASL